MASPNQRIGEYVLDRLIGQGAFGEVWLARHHVWPDRLVAVKIPTDPLYVRDLQREGSAVQALEHPNIVRAIGADPFAEPPYLITEYVPGTSLRPLVQRNDQDRATLQPAEAAAILSQVLRGLAYAHGQGIVHRDVKPENILINERASRQGYDTEGLVKLTDFGLGHASDALRQGSGGAGSIVYSASATATAGRVAGSQPYMAPEQRDGANVDGRADLFACGVVLFEMLTGHRPAGTEVPSDVNPELPKAYDEVFRRSYARLERRYASADEFLAALSEASRAAPIAPPADAKQTIPAGAPAPPPASVGRKSPQRVASAPGSAISRLFMGIVRGIFSGAIAVGVLVLLLAAGTIAVIDGIKHLNGIAPIELRRAGRMMSYALAGAVALGAAAGGVAGIMVRPRRILRDGIILRALRASIGLLLGGGLGFVAFWLLLKDTPSQALGVPIATTAGALAGALLGARSGRPARNGILAYGKRSDRSVHPAFDRPVRVASAVYPPSGRGREKGLAANVTTTAKALLLVFAVLLVAEYALPSISGIVGCSVGVAAVIVIGFVAHHFLRHGHR